jgi:hypothetical protein
MQYVLHLVRCLRATQSDSLLIMLLLPTSSFRIVNNKREIISRKRIQHTSSNCKTVPKSGIDPAVGSDEDSCT